MQCSPGLLAGLFILSHLAVAGADEKTYPANAPVLKYEMPASWTSEVDPASGSVSIGSEDGLISVNFTEVHVEATMELFKTMAPEMTKVFKGTEEVDKAKEQTSEGLTGFSASYTGMVEGSRVIMIIVLFKAGKDRSILGNFVLEKAAKLSKEQREKFEGFMKSLKGVAN